MTDQKRVLVIYGTRPEAIKLAPLVAALSTAPGIVLKVAVTGQHRAMLDQVNTLFGIVPDFDLDIIAARQTLAGVTTRALDGLHGLIAEDRPHAVVVQGDTTTSFVGALAAFYHQVPVVHLEAGLRTGVRGNPFPEEMNRRLASQLTDLHLAPTTTSRGNLIAEGIDPSSIVVTGNTVIDALFWTVAKRLPYGDSRIPELIKRSRRVVLVTAHRRESWGEPMSRVSRAIADLARRHPTVGFVLPAHLNPVVREVLLPPLEGLANILVVEPLPYGEFCRLMSDSDILLTDSGGVQEEAPSLGKPVLLLRETTERPEGVQAGVVQLVGTDHGAIVDAVNFVLTDRRTDSRLTPSRSPYGDGRAASRGLAAIQQLLGQGQRLADFDSQLD